MTDLWIALPQNRYLFLRIGMWLVAVPLLWLLSAILNARAGRAHVTWAVGLLPIAAVVGLAFKVWRDRNVAKSAIAHLRGATGIEFRFDAAGFFYHPARQQQQQHAWSALHGYVETPSAFAIYFAPALVTVVPKRAFAEAERARLGTQLLMLVPNRALPGTAVWRPTTRTMLLALLVTIASLVVWQVVESS